MRSVHTDASTQFLFWVSAIRQQQRDRWVPGFAIHVQARRNTPPNRVCHPADRQFASGCSPPSLTTTQLPSATGSWHTLTRTFTVLVQRLHRRTHDALRAKSQKQNRQLCYSIKNSPIQGGAIIISLHHGDRSPWSIHSQKNLPGKLDGLPCPGKLDGLPCCPSDAGHLVCGLQRLESHELPGT